MKTNPIYQFLIIFFLMACSPKQDLDSQNEIDIPELKKYHQTLLNAAQDWSVDAYLYEVGIPIDKGPWLLSAGFYSPTKPYESLGIYMDFQNELSKQVFSHEHEIFQEEPILVSQLNFGSREALNIFLSEEDVIHTIVNLCGDLKLRRVPKFENRPVLWSLTYYECGLFHNINYLYLDPVTGEMIVP